MNNIVQELEPLKDKLRNHSLYNNIKDIENIFLKIGKIDRRWIFIIIAVVVIIPLIVPIGLPIRATDTSKSVYDALENLPKGSNVLLSVEYSPSTKPENHPMTISVLRHLFRNDHKVYVTCLWPDGQFMAQDALNQVAEGEFNKVYGQDYVLLGYRPGGEAVVKGIVSNIRKLFSVDARQTKVDEIPLMDGIKNFKDFDFSTELTVFPSLSEKKRFRTDYNFYNSIWSFPVFIIF